MHINQLNLDALIEQIGKEKNIDKSILVSALEEAMLSAARKTLMTSTDLEARYNEGAGEIEVYEFRRIVDEVQNPSVEISFQEAIKMDPQLSVDDIGGDLGIKLDSKDFGRIAAQNAKQIIIQRVREAERSLVYEEYKNRKGELITGIVRRFERGSMVVDLGRTEAIVPAREQVPKENIRIGDRIVAYIVDVLDASRGAQIILSRTHPYLVARLFEQEVPEIADGSITIEGVAREAGLRTKIAVCSRDSDVDPVGACVGLKGSRVQAVVQELRGEKIDIVPFEQDAARFVCNTLAPAEATRVLVNEAEHSMQIIVPDDQLSLAIGRRGQNVRLAAELTGWKIDIYSESKVAQERDVAWASLSRIEGLSEFQIQTLCNHNIKSANDILKANEEFLALLPSIDPESVIRIRQNAQKVVDEEQEIKEHQNRDSAQEAKNLFLLEGLNEDSLSFTHLAQISEEKRAALQQASYEDISDIFLEKNLSRLATVYETSPEEAQNLKGAVRERLKQLTSGKIL